MVERAQTDQIHQAESLVKLSCADFQRDTDGSWTAIGQIDLAGPRKSQRLIPAGRRFSRGQMFLFGIDLAAFLDQECGH